MTVWCTEIAAVALLKCDYFSLFWHWPPLLRCWDPSLRDASIESLWPFLRRCVVTVWCTGKAAVALLKCDYLCRNLSLPC